MIKLKKIQNISVSLHANITVYFKFSTQYFYCFRDPGSFQDRCVWWVDCLSALLWFGWVWCSNHHALWRVLHLCCKYTIKGLASTLYTLYTARLIMGPVRSDSCDKQTAPATDFTAPLTVGIVNCAGFVLVSRVWTTSIWREENKALSAGWRWRRRYH